MKAEPESDIKADVIILLMTLIIIASAIWNHGRSDKLETQQVAAAPAVSVSQMINDGNVPLLTPRDLQQALINRGWLKPNDPNATDGELGRITLKAWERCNCNEYAEMVGK